jgi:hypothetical protein
MLDWFESHGLLATVNGMGTADEVTDRLVAAIDHVRHA